MCRRPTQSFEEPIPTDHVPPRWTRDGLPSATSIFVVRQVEATSAPACGWCPAAENCAGNRASNAGKKRTRCRALQEVAELNVGAQTPSAEPTANDYTQLGHAR